jgi:PilZ domain
MALIPAQQPDRRRSPRRLQDVPLIVRGESAEKQTFIEETFTISVSAHGALVLLANKVSLGQKIVLVNPGNKQEQEGRVSRLGNPYGGLAQVAVEFARPVPEFWPEPLPAKRASI